MRALMRKNRQRDRRRYSLLVMLAVAFLVNTAGMASAGTVDHSLRRALQTRSSSDRIPVIVHLTEKADLRAFRGAAKGARRAAIVKTLRSKADATQKDLSVFLRQRRAERIRPLWIVNGISATVAADDVELLAAQPGVYRIVLDAVVHAPVATFATGTTSEWNLTAIHAPDLWGLGYTGQGTVVANMDTGVDYDHPDLQLRWRGGLNSWFDPHNEHPLTPYDAAGHGTQTMGIMVGGDAGGTNIGVAPGAQWIAVKIFNDAGAATYSVIHQGFQWLLDPDGDPDTDDAPDVVNNSWGLVDPAHGCILEFQPDVQALRTAGIALSFSAGNDGPDPATSVSPANYPESFSVGAVNSANALSSASSRGPSSCYGDYFPTVVAPGVNVRTTDLYLGIPDAYVQVSGTSFAAPHVAGSMALLLSAFPGITLGDLEHHLRNSALDLGPAGPDNESGFGLIDALASHSALLSSPTGSVAINGSAATTNSRYVALSLSAADQQDAVTNMRFSWDSAVWYAWEPYAVARNATLPAGEGMKTISVQFRDAAGNVSAVYTDSILLDQTPPTGSVTINSNAAATSSRSVTLSLSAADTANAATNMRFSWDNVTWYAWEAYATARNATLPAGDGTKTIYAQFRDAAGNVSASYTDNILLDQIPPTGSVIINSGAATTASRYVTLLLSAADTATAVTSMRFSWDNVVWYAWEPYATTRNATIPGAAGLKTLSVKFADTLGNASTAYSDTIQFAP